MVVWLTSMGTTTEETNTMSTNVTIKRDEDELGTRAVHLNGERIGITWQNRWESKWFLYLPATNTRLEFPTLAEVRAAVAENTEVSR